MTLGAQNAEALPDLEYGAVLPAQFREFIMSRGAVMLRKAADPKLLDTIRSKLDDLFAQYSRVPQSEIDKRIASDDPVERDFWEQIKLSHIYDKTFKSFANLSYFDIARQSGLWEMIERAFPESSVTESRVCNSRRITEGGRPDFFDKPIEFHVDAQVFYTHQLSINLWTPLVDCGVKAPGLKVILLGVRDTLRYLEYNEAGYKPEPGDIANMHKFRCQKMLEPALADSGLLERAWAPEFRKGDVLAFTNFTMHATHSTPEMTLARTSVEVRVDLPNVRYWS